MKSIKSITEPGRTIPVMAETEVLVIGGGPAGLSAAISAARMGVETMLVERYGCFGGNITLSAVEPPSWYRQPNTVEAGGIAFELEERMVKLGATQKCMFDSIGLSLDTEIFKYMADGIIKENGIIPLFHCMGVYPYMEGNTVKGVITESKSGRTVILAQRVIDCTGDGDIAYYAGAPYEKGDANDGKLMGATLVFGTSGVDIKKFEEFVEQHPDIRDPHTLKALYHPFVKAAENGEWPHVSKRMFFNSLTYAGEATGLNHVFIPDVDGTNVWDMTRAEIEGRQHVLDSIKVLKKYQPGFENCKLRTFAMCVGFRETRRITGGYTITREDILNEARFEDSIGIFPVYLDGLGVVIIPDTGIYFQVPYRIILPQKVENLLVAGRCISGTRDAVPTTRQMNFCSVTGQGAGVAAALSIKDNVSLRGINISKLQESIKKQGVRIA